MVIPVLCHTLILTRTLLLNNKCSVSQFQTSYSLDNPVTISVANSVICNHIIGISHFTPQCDRSLMDIILGPLSSNDYNMYKP